MWNQRVKSISANRDTVFYIKGFYKRGGRIARAEPGRSGGEGEEKANESEERAKVVWGGDFGGLGKGF